MILILFYSFMFLFIHFTMWFSLVVPVMHPGEYLLAFLLAIPGIGTALMTYGWIIGEL